MQYYGSTLDYLVFINLIYEQIYIAKVLLLAYKAEKVKHGLFNQLQNFYYLLSIVELKKERDKAKAQLLTNSSTIIQSSVPSDTCESYINSNYTIY